MMIPTRYYRLPDLSDFAFCLQALVTHPHPSPDQ